MKPLGQELSQLAARKPVQEFRQRFLDCAAGSSARMSTGQPVYNVIKAERRLAESWTQVHLVPHNWNSLISSYRLFRRPPSAPKITPLTQC